MKMPKSPFATQLSGSAKETELRLRSIFQWKKKRPPVVLFVLMATVVLMCFSLFSCTVEEPQAENPLTSESVNLDHGKTSEQENETSGDPSVEEDILFLGSPLDETGSILGVDQLFDRPCVYQEFVNVTADPNRPNSYLYTFRFFYRGDGSEYLSGGEETTLLTVYNCRKVLLSDYDNDGIVELFVQPEHEERLFVCYDMENGEIVSGSVDEASSTIRFVRIMAVTEDTVMRNCYFYTHSDPMDDGAHEVYQTRADYPLTKDDAVMVLEEMDGVSRVSISTDDIPKLYGFVDSDLLRGGFFSIQTAIVYSVPGYAAPGDDTPVTELAPGTVQLFEMQGEWVKVQSPDTGEEQYWMESSHLRFGYEERTDYEAPAKWDGVLE